MVFPFLLQMPCWYYDRKELKYTPSSKDGIDTGTEMRYRREGARFILDTGIKLGLYPSCFFFKFLYGDLEALKYILETSFINTHLKTVFSKL